MNKHKMVAIQSICELDYDLGLPIDYFVVEGEILDVSYDDKTFTIHDTYERNGQIIPSIRGEFNDDVFKYFIHLADWRDKRIDEILDNE